VSQLQALRDTGYRGADYHRDSTSCTSRTYDEDDNEEGNVTSPPASTEDDDPGDGCLEGPSDDEDLTGMRPQSLNYSEEDSEEDVTSEAIEGEDRGMEVDADGEFDAGEIGQVSLLTVVDPSVYRWPYRRKT
jgi:hypothetical protein